MSLGEPRGVVGLPDIHAGAQRVLSWLTRISSFFVPSACGGCRRPGELICAECRMRAIPIDWPMCLRCGRRMAQTVERCWSCRHNATPMDQVHAAFLYTEPISTIIHQMKYKGAFALAAPLVELMLRHPVQWHNPPELLVPVPLHPVRQRQRGYNQSTLLARELAHHWRIPVDEKALQRIRYTTPQVGLNAIERHANVAGAFVADPQRVQNKHILLIDDVYTTGATLSAATLALQEAETCSVAAFCASRRGRTG